MRQGWIVVTGAGRGIGAAIAADIETRGGKVAAFSRSGNAPHGKAVACDVSDERGFAVALDKLAKDAPVVGLVNNAGMHRFGPSESERTEDFETMLRVNAVAVFAACRIAYPHLKAANGATIVNIGSFFDKLGISGQAAYCASKAAVGAITRCLAVEWARDKIQVVDVAPGYVATDMSNGFLESERGRAWIAKRSAVGRAGSAEEIARFVGSLFADDIPFLTGETIYLDGGQGLRQ